jgi:hypothetical protein
MKKQMKAESISLKMGGLDRKEWNIWQDCPEEQLEECLVYEAARRSQFWPIAFEEMRRLGHPNQYHMRLSGELVFRFLCLFEEFPKKSWLTIPGKKRRRQLTALASNVKHLQPIESRDRYEEQITYHIETDTMRWGDNTSP